MRRQAASRRRGMTLLEILVVIGLLAIVSAIGWWVMRESYNLWQRQSEVIATRRAVWTALNRISREVTEATMAPGVSFTGGTGSGLAREWVPFRFAEESTTAGQRLEQDTLAFAYPEGEAVVDGSSVISVSYRIAHDGRGDVGLQETNRGLNAPATLGASSFIGEGGENRIVAFDVKYQKRGAAADDWLDAWTDSAALPQAVKITVGAWEDAGGGEVTIRSYSSYVVLREATRIEK